RSSGRSVPTHSEYIPDATSGGGSSGRSVLSAAQYVPGPRELTGAVDLISQYKLQPHHDFFCKRPLPLAISDTHYLHNVVGDTEIRKGEGMKLGQLVQNAYLRDKPAYIQPFDMETLGQAFQLRETAPVDLPSAEKGIPTISG
uniref:Uncharacterized protein n=1 Tax=Aegilops tauschii subsp. strangulata TaxID=200361 RepID=A0A453K293_AEGTS